MSQGMNIVHLAHFAKMRKDSVHVLYIGQNHKDDTITNSVLNRPDFPKGCHANMVYLNLNW